jgi:tetratricopeptide (TPR) repeat protein
MITSRLPNKFRLVYVCVILLIVGCTPRELTRARELFNLASVYRINGEDSQADQAYREAILSFQKIIEEETKDPKHPGNLQVLAQAYALQAFAYIELGEFKEAEETIQQGSSLLLNANPRERELFYILSGILQTAQAAKLNEKEKGRFQQNVVDLYKEAAATFKALLDMPGVERDSDIVAYAREAEAISYGNIAAEYEADFGVNKNVNSLDKAIEYLQKAKETCEQLLAMASNKNRPYTQYLLNQYTRELELAKRRKENVS